MKKLFSHFIIGVLVFTSLCTGVFEIATQALAHQSPMTVTAQQQKDQSVNCCSKLAHDSKLVGHLPQNEQKSKTRGTHPANSELKIHRTGALQQDTKIASLLNLRKPLSSVVLLE